MSCLYGYDIIYIVDDSSSMSWEEKNSRIVPWPHARNALVSFATICSAWDQDGQDIYFINVNEPVLRASPKQIEQAFNLRTPYGGTNMGRRLQQVASNYFAHYQPGITKPVNVIAITDGQFTDDAVGVIRWIVDKLDQLKAPPNQFGIQFVQIGADKAARKYLEKLDDELSQGGFRRDIVDTVPWAPGKMDGVGFDGTYLTKVVCGAINKRFDYTKVKGAKMGGGIEHKKKEKSKMKKFFL